MLNLFRLVMWVATLCGMAVAGAASPQALASGDLGAIQRRPDGQSAPAITAVTGLAASSGGTLVAISGTGFTGATAVTFGGVAANSVSVVSDTQITAIAPAAAIGTVNVAVTGPGGMSAPGPAAQITYYQFSLGMNSRAEGPAAGADTVLLNVLPAVAPAWTATADVPWLHLGANAASGSGYSVIAFSFDGNSGPTRTGTLTVAGMTFTVVQGAATYVQAAPLTTLFSGLSGPQGVAVDGAGTVYVADTSANAVSKWNPNTQQLVPIVTSGLSKPYAVAVDSSGNVFIADTYNNAIKEWNAGTEQVTTLATGVPQPLGLVVDAFGNVIFSEGEAPSGSFPLQEWMPGSQQVVTQVSSGLSNPRGLALDGSGNLYVVDYGSGLKVVPAGSQQAVAIATTGGINPAWAVSVDGGGNLNFANGFDNGVAVLTAGSQQSQQLVSYPVSDPLGIAADSAGNLFIADPTYKGVMEVPRAFVDSSMKAEPAGGGSDSLAPVLPAQENLSGSFAPTADQNWITITGVANGIVSFSCASNPSYVRTGHITVLGQSIPVVQAGLPALSFSIATQPQSQVAGPGGTVTFTAAAAGSPGPSAQWQVSTDGGSTWTTLADTAGVSGSSSFSLTLTSLTTAMDGFQYRVVMTNSTGTLASSAALLGVSTRGLISGSVLNEDAPGSAQLTGAFTIEGTTPKQMLIRAVGPSLGGSGNVALPSLEIDNATTGAVVATNDGWGTAPNVAQIQSVTSQVGAYPLGSTASADSVILNTFAPGTYVVRIGTANLGGNVSFEIYDADSSQRLVYMAAEGIYGVNGSTAPFTQKFTVNYLPAGRKYLIRALGPSLGVYGEMQYPTLTVADSNGTILAGISAWGNDPVVAAAAAAVGAQALPAASSDAALLFTPPGPGTYAASATGGPGTVMIEVIEVDSMRAGTASPAIVAEPQAAVTSYSSTAAVNFGVVATGLPAPTYQWRRNGTPILGATGALLSVAGPQDITTEGNYDVVVTNASGTAQSPVATLTLLTGRPGIASQPQSQSVSQGTNVSFSVAISGTPTPTYQWQVSTDGGNNWTNLTDGNGVTGSSSGTLVLTSVRASMSGYMYRVIATDWAGSATSYGGTLTILSQGTYHSADEGHTYAINLLDLTRVVELYNTHNGTSRTGAYTTQAGTEDGFAPDSSRAAGATATLSNYHSADETQSAFITLSDLTRVIELYNYHNGATRTGQYHVQAGTEDGFAPGP